MSFDKHYPNRKDWRKPYLKGGAAARSCRPHGGCPYCEGRRMLKRRIIEEIFKDELRDFVKTTEEDFIFSSTLPTSTQF